MLDSADTPQNLYVEFENLAFNTQVADYQKDVLIQVLREAYPAVANILDFGDKELNSKNNTMNDSKKPIKSANVSLKCLECGMANDSTIYASKTLEKFSTNSPNDFDAQFTVNSSNSKAIKWKISLSSFKNGGAEKKQTAPSIGITSINNLGKPVVYKENKSEIAKHSLPTTFILKANELVNVNYNGDSGLQIKTSGRALQSGNVGNKIKIEITSGWVNGNMHRKIIEAKVLDSGEVEYAR